MPVVSLSVELSPPPPCRQAVVFTHSHEIKTDAFFFRREISQNMTFRNPPASVGEFMKTCTSTSMSCICLFSRVLILRNIFIFLSLDASVILFLNKHVFIDWSCYWLTDLLNTFAINFCFMKFAVFSIVWCYY